MSSRIQTEKGEESNKVEKKRKTKSEGQTTEETKSLKKSKRIEKSEKSEKSKKSKKDEEGTEEEDSPYGARDVATVLLPVSCCIVVVVAVVMSVWLSPTINVKATRASSSWNVMGESESKDGWENTWRAVVNGLVVLGIIILMTCMMLTLYYFKLYKILWVFIGVSITLGIVVESYFVHVRVFKVLNLAVSFPTYVFVCLNWAILVCIAILWKAPPIVQQVGMVYLSCSMSLLLQLMLPEYTGWIVLGLLVIWDLVAVLAPCGPLKKFVELADERDERNSGPLNALVYSSSKRSAKKEKREKAGKDEEMKLNPKEEEKKKEGENEEEEEASGIKLGLGDFVFYSILMGKVAETGFWTSIVACYVAVLGGLLATLLLLIIRRHALPALPISLTFGIIFYFGGQHAVLPCLDDLQSHQLFL